MFSSTHRILILLSATKLLNDNDTWFICSNQYLHQPQSKNCTLSSQNNRSSSCYCYACLWTWFSNFGIRFILLETEECSDLHTMSRIHLHHLFIRVFNGLLSLDDWSTLLGLHVSCLVGRQWNCFIDCSMM